MPNLAHTIVCAGEGLCSDRGAELFAQMFVTEAIAAAKPGHRELTTERMDASTFKRDVSLLSIAHDRSPGDMSIIAMDAASAIANANYRLNVLASYDFFDDVEYLAQSTGSSADDLRIRLHAALRRADRIVVVTREASRMAWLYLDQSFIQRPLPPVAAYSNPASDTTKPILIIVHQPEIAAAREIAGKLQALHPNSVIIDVGEDEPPGGVPTCIAMAVHIGRDVGARAGLRIVDCWWSEIPVVQLAFRTANSVTIADEEFPANGTLIHNETGLVAANAVELNRHVAAVLNDPILYATLVRRSKIDVVKQAHHWRELVQVAFHDG